MASVSQSVWDSANRMGATARNGMPLQPIQTVAVQSSFIAAMEYDQVNLTLTTHLKSGAIYQHKFCLPQEWEMLKTAKSPASHWSKAIKGKKASVRIKSAKAPTASIKTGRQ